MPFGNIRCGWNDHRLATNIDSVIIKITTRYDIFDLYQFSKLKHHSMHRPYFTKLCFVSSATYGCGRSVRVHAHVVGTKYYTFRRLLLVRPRCDASSTGHLGRAIVYVATTSWYGLRARWRCADGDELEIWKRGQTHYTMRRNSDREGRSWEHKIVCFCFSLKIISQPDEIAQHSTISYERGKGCMIVRCVCRLVTSRPNSNSHSRMFQR